MHKNPRIEVGTGRIEFRVLGPLEVTSDGEELRLGGPRQRALLAALLLSANRVVSRQRLIDELLGDSPSHTADHALRVQVSRLRTALNGRDGGQSRILTRPPGYVLRVDRGELDLESFEDLLAQGRAAVRENDPERAAALLAEAESLWRGRALADLHLEPFIRLEAQRLDELRLAAIEERIEAELALGRHASLCPELETLVAQHPLRERLRGQLMLALYRSGRQADALASYRAGRALLVERLGLEPSAELRKLEQAILRQDPALDGPTPPIRPRATWLDQPAPRRPVTRPLHRWALGSVAVGAVVLAGVLLSTGSARPARRIVGDVVAVIGQSNAAARPAVTLDAAPADIAFGFGSLWVSEPRDGDVTRIDPSSSARIATIPVGRRPDEVIAADDAVWVLDGAERTVSRIDPTTDRLVQAVALGGDPDDLAAAAGSLWVANANGTVARIDASTGARRTTIGIGGEPVAVAAAAGSLWAASEHPGTITRIDPDTGRVVRTIDVRDSPIAIAAAASRLWVLTRGGDAELLRLDPAREAVTGRVALKGRPTRLAVDGTAVWAIDTAAGTLQRVQPGSLRVSATVRIGEPVAAGVGAKGLWLAAGASGSSHRGGTLTAVTAGPIVTTIDPAASTSPDMPPLQFLGLTNDGLVTLDHVTGHAGVRLVPDLARALPRPADGGRTYTFVLRPRIRYSTGAFVQPSDVRHSFERLFALGSSGAARYDALVGAPECERHHRGCDLRAGIVADDRSHTVTFHLRRPDPDFLYKLTLTYADVLPVTAPEREASPPLPATGPYEISRYVPGQEVLFVRNPHFREWSASAQPRGFPDTIVLRLSLNQQQAAAAVASGRADFLGNIGGIPPGVRGVFARNRSRVRIRPAMVSDFAFLNVHAPPFDDVRVRRALNLAVDRAAVAADYGGRAAATPTCQILPPQIPGYRPYCPYTRGASIRGRWQSPDLARARRLVAASGTRGMKVTVWEAPPPHVLAEEGQVIATALRRLGFRASMRTMDYSAFVPFTDDSRNRAQVIQGGWSADYPTADDFIGKLTCGYFVPGNGPATTDASEFCDPAIDRQAAAAASLQTAAPGEADAMWADLDRRLTNRAIWLPTVNLNEIDFLSRRVGNYKYNPVWGALLDQLWVR